MTKKKYRRYSSEFKRLALKRANEDGVTDKKVCKDLGVSERQLRRWRDQFDRAKRSNLGGSLQNIRFGGSTLDANQQRFANHISTINKLASLPSLI